MAHFQLSLVLFLFVFLALSVQSVAVNVANTCGELKRLFGSKLSLPATREYSIVAPENWSETAQLSPGCLFEPDTAQDVANALRIPVQRGTEFAVRGGGHMPVPGAANINGGVLLSLGNMRTMQMTNRNTIAQLGPGLRWNEVYNWTAEYGLAVSGGRYAPVGVPGYLLGGGVNFFGSRYGWSSNMVSNYELVLANSSIVNANAKENPDLFWALKGGSNNYGVVTRFDVKTFPSSKVYGGLSIFKPQYLDDFVNAAASYSVIGGGSDDINASYNPSVQIDVSTGNLTLLSWCAYQGSDPNPAAFANFSRIPTLSSNNKVMSSLADLTTETNTDAFSGRTQRQVFWATGLKPSPKSVRLANTTFFEMVDEMPELKKVKGLVLTTTPQMLTRAWLQAARASGGDPMDLEPGNGIILHLIGSAWESEGDDELVYEFSRRLIAAIDERSKAQGLYSPFIYINDAGPGQEPFKLYGNGNSIHKMKAVRDRYGWSTSFFSLHHSSIPLSGS
ncbi:FAD binding domain protein [Xylariaceae sp. AK1471]|nr:FAD binding domain protein [Xylariaceae sp. AK1471]